MACTECRRRQVKVSTFSCIIIPNIRGSRLPWTIASYSAPLPTPLVRHASDALSARSNASSCPFRNRNFFPPPITISPLPLSPCTCPSMGVQSVVSPVKCPLVPFWVTLPTCVRGYSAPPPTILSFVPQPSRHRQPPCPSTASHASNWSIRRRKPTTALEPHPGTLSSTHNPHRRPLLDTQLRLQ
jgi:hypothetical protein